MKHPYAKEEIIGTAQPFEKDYFSKDVSRAPVLIAAASLDTNVNQGTLLCST
jgi:hypothetical protein